MINDFKKKCEELKALIDNSESILIASHVNPDGDNLGSILALYETLKILGKKPSVIIDDFIPADFRFLPNLQYAIKSGDIKEEQPDLFISLDLGAIDRLGKCEKLFNNSKHTVNIDHHLSNHMFAELNIVDSKASATGELLFNIFSELDFELNKDVATCLYTAISSDTGSFKYDSITEETFIAAGKLLKYKININEIAVNLYQSRSVEKTALLIDALNGMKYHYDNRVALVKVSMQNIIDNNAHASDTEGIVEFVRDIAGVELSILLKEKEDEVKLSLRTKSYIDATKIIAHFSGGGHIRAAGATIHTDLEQAEKLVMEVVEKEFY